MNDTRFPETLYVISTYSEEDRDIVYKGSIDVNELRLGIGDEVAIYERKSVNVLREERRTFLEKIA